MLTFVVPACLGLLVGFGWLIVWGVAIRVPLIVWLARSRKERSQREQRLVCMGRWRYIFVVGVLGSGLAFALSTTVMGLAHSGVLNWRWTMAYLIFSSLSFGLFQGSISWDSFPKAPPITPNYPPAK